MPDSARNVKVDHVRSGGAPLPKTAPWHNRLHSRLRDRRRSAATIQSAIADWNVAELEKQAVASSAGSAPGPTHLKIGWVRTPGLTTAREAVIVFA